MQKPCGCGAEGTCTVDLALFCGEVDTAAIETADVNTNIPASAIALSMRFSYGLVAAP
jgi:hypothetical protein